MLFYKRVISFLIFFVFNCAYADDDEQFLTLENSSLLEFTLLVSQLIHRPVIISSPIDVPFSINASFRTEDDLISLLRSAVLSSGFRFDERGKSIVVSQYGFIDSPDFITKTYPFRYLSSKEALSVFKGFFSNISKLGAGKKSGLSKKNNLSSSFVPVVVESTSINALIVTATKYQHDTIERIVDQIDKPQKQILIEAVISEVSSKDFKGLDSKLQYANQLNLISSDLQQFHPALGFSLRLINSKSLRFFLDYLETSDSSRILSQPKILTLNRQEASVVVGQDVPFVTGQSTSSSSDTSNPFQTIQRAQVGLKLRIRPVLLPSGLIQLDIYQENSSVTDDSFASDIITNVRSFSSKVILLNGQSVLLGGLKTKSQDHGRSGSIPVISDLPIIGWLFSSRRERLNDMNLLVLITAKVFSVGQVPSNDVHPQDGRHSKGLTNPEYFGFDVPVTHHYKSIL